MSNVAESPAGGITFTGLLTIVLIVLKLCGVITWSWWWVTSPMWMPFFIMVIVFAGLLLISGLVILVESITGKK